MSSGPIEEAFDKFCKEENFSPSDSHAWFAFMSGWRAAREQPLLHEYYTGRDDNPDPALGCPDSCPKCSFERVIEHLGYRVVEK